jgi:hypothetical protein
MGILVAVDAKDRLRRGSFASHPINYFHRALPQNGGAGFGWTTGKIARTSVVASGGPATRRSATRISNAEDLEPEVARLESLPPLAELGA